MKALLSEQASVHRPAGLMVLARLGNIVLGIATVPVLLHFLGSEGFAAWAVLLAIAFAFSALELGMPLTFVKHAAPLVQAGNWRGVDGVLGTAWLMLACVFLLAGLPLAWFAPRAARELHLPDAPAMSAAAMVLAVFAAAAARSLLQFGAYTFLAARRFRALAATVFLQSFLANLAAAIAAACTRRLDLALLAYWAAQLLATALGFVFSRALFVGGAGGAAPSWRIARELMPHGLKIQLSDWAQIVTFQFDKFIIAGMVGLVSVAPYEVANRSVTALRSIPSSGLDSFLPSAAIGQHSPEETWQRYVAVTRLAATAVSVFMVAPLAIAPVFLYAWTGQMGFLSRGVFVALSCGFAANVLALPAAALVQAAARADLQARAAMLTLLVNIPLSLLLLWQWGMVGAAAGTSVAMTAGAALLLADAHRAYGRPLRPTLALVASYWPALVVCALFGLVAYLPFERWFVAIPEAARDGWRTRLAAAAAAGVAYLSCIGAMLLVQWRFGLVPREQYQALREWLRARWSIRLPASRSRGS